MSGIVYYVLDTETTGLNANYHEMSEVGIVRFSDMRQLFTAIKCEHPERANWDALAVTKKKLSDLSKGMSKTDAVNWCNKFFAEDGLTSANRCIVAHNAPFDRKFVHALWESLGKEFPADLWVDTMSMTRNYIKKSGLAAEAKEKGLPKPRVNLHASCDIVGIKKLSEAHNAKVDSQNTYFLWKKLKDIVDYLPSVKSFPHKISKAGDTNVPDDNDNDDGIEIDVSDFQ